MPLIYLAAALSVQISTFLPSVGNDTTSYAKAYRLAARSDRQLLVVLEDRQDARGQLHSLASSESLRLTAEFQVCRIDVNTPHGAEIARSYQAVEFPYTVVTDRRGEIIYRGIGQLGGSHPLRRRRSSEAAEVDRQPEPQFTDVTLKDDTVDTDQTDDLKPFEPEDEAIFAVTDLDEAQQRALQRNRLLVAFVTTRSCHYCIKMKREAFSDPALRAKVSRNFVSARIDGDRYAAWADQHGIRMYPTVLVLSSHGQLVDRIEGYVSADQLTSRLDQAASQLVSLR